jgi:glycosyltransferase involved in cell wall biosynthesis
MHIAQIAPLWERVPPHKYGAIEALVGSLTDGLVQRGHKVTLFASGDSLTCGTLFSVHDKALHHDPQITEPEIYRLLQLCQVVDHADSFDIIHSHLHSHTGCMALPFLRNIRVPVVHTIHSFFTNDNIKLFRQCAEQSFISVSHGQRRYLPNINYIATVHHGIYTEHFPFRAQPDTPPYLVFLGRIRPEKGADIAIEVARRTGFTLKMAGRIKHQDRQYFEQSILPFIDGQQVQFLDELDFSDKTRLMAGATATLFPTQVPEPFGLVLCESMACGTPVVSFKGGAVSEIIKDGETGFVADTLSDMVEKVLLAASLSRYACREYVQLHFSVERMVDGYEAVYRQIVKKEKSLF